MFRGFLLAMCRTSTLFSLQIIFHQFFVVLIRRVAVQRERHRVRPEYFLLDKRASDDAA
jgi:hypothetical protein